MSHLPAPINRFTFASWYRPQGATATRGQCSFGLCKPSVSAESPDGPRGQTNRSKSYYCSRNGIGGARLGKSGLFFVAFGGGAMFICFFVVCCTLFRRLQGGQIGVGWGSPW